MCHLRLVCCTIVSLMALTAAAPAQAQSAHESFDVEVAGSGPAILLIPGLMTPGDVWDTTVARYRDRYQLHVLTLAGFGGPPSVPAPFLPRVRDEVIAYVRAQGLQRPLIVGHSLGGFLAFWIAATAPDLVGGIVAVDGVPFLPALGNANATVEAARAQAEQIRSLYASFSPDQLVAQSRIALQAMITAETDRDRALAWAGACDPGMVGLAIAELMSTDLREAAAAITAPTLLIGALGAAPESMRGALEEGYRAQVSRIPAARVIMAAGARHFIMLDDPAFLFGAVDAFLAAHHTAGSGGRQ